MKLNDWNEYRIRCEGPRIQLWVNGVQTVDYTETEPNIAQDGQDRGADPRRRQGRGWYKDIVIEEL